MKAAFRQGENVYLKDIEERPLAAGQIRVRVEACGVCGTDLWETGGDEEKVLTGHEVAGVVAELGPAVTGLEIGQRIVLDSSTPCGRCSACRNMQQELCTDVQSFFILGSFGFAETMVAPAINAIPYEDLEPAVACLQEPLGVAIDMLRLADIEPRSNVLVVGGGPIGLMATALARRAGARRVFVASLGDRLARADLAHACGADRFVDVDKTPIEAVDYGCAIDRVLVTSPPRTLPAAFQLAAKAGIVVFIGIEHGEGAYCTFEANDFHFKKLQLRASFASPALFGPLALQYLREGVIDGPAFVSHRFGLSDIAAALDTARNAPDAVKVVVTP